MKYIAFFHPAMNIGGKEKVFVTYVNHLANNNRLDFVVCRNEGVLLSEISKRVNIHNLGDLKLRASLLALRRYIKKNKPEIIFTGGDYPNMFLILACQFLKDKPKIVISQHNYFNKEVYLGKITKIFMRIVYPHAYKAIALTPGIAKYLEKDIHMPKEKIIILPNPVDTTTIISKSVQQLTIETPSDYIVFVGRLSVVKNLNLLLDAFELIANEKLCLMIVGDGEEYSRLKAKVNSMRKKSQVILTGNIANPLPIIKGAKALILPSFTEAFPTVVIESLTLNTPIVSTPNSGCVEIASKSPNVYISKSFNNPKEFAMLIEKAILSQYNDGMSKIVEKYSTQNILSRLENEILNF